MVFAASRYAWFLFLLPLVALLKIWADARGQRAVRAFASSDRLRPQLLGGASTVWSGLHFGAQLLALGFFILALTRPQWGIESKEIEQDGRNIFIAIDTSKSMLADDMAPNRLTRAKLAALDLLDKLPGDRVGVIAFAGRSFLQAPLTTDHDAVRETINSLDHTSIPRGGSSLAAAINLALEIVAKTKGQQAGMIIFSDGQETDAGTLAAAKDAAKKHLLILPVGVGTVEGSLVPDPAADRQGDYLRDENGKVVKARLEFDLLQQVARITGGEYVELASQPLSQRILDRVMANLDRQRAGSRSETKMVERYRWPLFAGIVLLFLSLSMNPASRKLVRQPPPLPVERQAQVHRPPPLPSWSSTALAVALMVSFTGTAHAVSIDDARDARRYYESQKYDQARDEYARMLNSKRPPMPGEELSYGLGASLMQLKDYERANNAFSEALKSRDKGLQARALRGLGTSLYNLGDTIAAKKPDATIKAWTDSRDHFDAALNRLPSDSSDYAEVKENRDFVQKRLDEIKEQQKQKQQQQQNGKDKEKQKEKQKGKGEGDGESDDGDPKDQQAEQNPDKDRESKQTDAMQKKQDQPRDGEIKADDKAGKDNPAQQLAQGDKPDDKKQNDKTGFSPQEARDQLRNYADDQKSVQYLMRRERPVGGKDY